MTNERDSIRTALKPSFFSFTHGTPGLFRVLIFPTASLPLATNSLFPSISLLVLTRSLRLHLVPLLPILATSPSASTHVRISPNYSFASSIVGIGNSLMLATLIFASTLLATSLLLGVPLDPIPSTERLINSCTLLQDHVMLHASSSYKLEFVSNPKRTQKKHASDLSPYPAELIPFEPLASADSRYGQLHKPLCESPFKEAGIHGFIPPMPFKVTSHFLTRGTLATSIGQLWANSMTRLPFSHGQTRQNNYVSYLVMTSMSNPFCAMGLCLCLFLTARL